MNNSRIPETVLKASSEGTHIIRAYREHLGYSIEELAIACGLAAEEIENIESGLRYNKGYRDRIARSLSLPEGTFDSKSDILDAAWATLETAVEANGSDMHCPAGSHPLRN